MGIIVVKKMGNQRCVNSTDKHFCLLAFNSGHRQATALDVWRLDDTVDLLP